MVLLPAKGILHIAADSSWFQPCCLQIHLNKEAQMTSTPSLSRYMAPVLALALLLAWTSAFAVEQLAYYPADSMEGVVDTALVTLDVDTSQDGKGALRISTKAPATVRLFETGDLDVENARLVYQAALKSKDLKGQAYLEMLCEFEGMGTYFSRALHAPISGTTGWVTQETPFFLQAGQNPVSVKLNLVLTGPGTVWVDALRLLQLPLQ